MEEEILEVVEEVTAPVEEAQADNPKLNLGSLAERFIRGKVSMILLPSGARVAKGKCYDIVDEDGECFGSVEVTESTRVDNVVTDLQLRHAVAMGHASVQAMLVHFFSTNDQEAWSEYAATTRVNPTRVPREQVDFLQERPAKVRKAKVLTVEFTPLPKPEDGAARPIGG